MAPPNKRRTGFSKRAQYSTFFGYVAAVVLALLAGLVLLYSLYRPDAFSGARGAAADVAEPVGQTVAAGRAEAGGFFSAIGGFFTSGARNARLEREAELARVRLAEANALAEENRRLKALLGLPQDQFKPVATARLIAASGASVRRFATISAGVADGVAPGMPVRSPLGLVGRVLEVSRGTARVLLITDTESVVPVRRARDGVPANARGLGNGTLRLGLFTLGINPLKPGDIFVTSGSGGLYHPGTAVAVVEKVSGDGAIARVLSSPTASEYVVVEPGFAESLGMPEATNTPDPQPKPPGKR